MIFNISHVLNPDRAPIEQFFLRGPPIFLFEHVSFRGRTVTVYGSYSDLRKKNFNDKTSSIVVTDGRWSVYKHINFQGVSATLIPGIYPNPRAWGNVPGNDQISSVKIVY